jgi:hypothetical protein
MDGVENSTVSENLFSRLDGIAIELLGHTRDVHIVSNDFEFLGGSAIVLWGRTSTKLDEHGARQLPSNFHPQVRVRYRVICFTFSGVSGTATHRTSTSQGPDSRELDVPLDTLIESNEAHDIGLLQKQSSLLFQAISARTILRRNVAYNLPRAAVNLNGE